jgi:hypothetical protein
MSHGYGRSSLWVLMCLANIFLVRSLRPQMSQLNSLVAVCVLSWNLRLVVVVKVFPHWLQICSIFMLSGSGTATGVSNNLYFVLCLPEMLKVLDSFWILCTLSFWPGIKLELSTLPFADLKRRKMCNNILCSYILHSHILTMVSVIHKLGGMMCDLVPLPPLPKTQYF